MAVQLSGSGYARVARRHLDEVGQGHQQTRYDKLAVSLKLPYLYVCACRFNEEQGVETRYKLTGAFMMKITSHEQVCII